MAPAARPDTIHDMDRLVLGFGGVELNASERVTANQTGSLAVYQTRGAWDAATNAYAYSGGDLTIHTPLLTGAAGSVNKIRAGGAVNVAAPAGATAPALTNAELIAALGAEAVARRAQRWGSTRPWRCPAASSRVSARGRCSCLATARGSTLPAARWISSTSAQYSWGGDVVLESNSGNILQTAGSRIDVSALENRAGKLTAVAVGAGAGTVDLRGAITGGSTGYYDAGGTRVPYAAGGADIRGQHVADFTGLNQRLTAGGVTGSRSFQIKQGDLTVGDELKAREISVSVDGGRLVVNGHRGRQRRAGRQHPPGRTRWRDDWRRRAAGRPWPRAARGQLRTADRGAQPRRDRHQRRAGPADCWRTARAWTCAPAPTARRCRWARWN